MLRSVEGINSGGSVKLSKTPDAKSPQLSAYGIDEVQAADLRAPADV